MIWTYGSDGHLGELFKGFCDGNGGIGHEATLALFVGEVVAGSRSSRGCVTNGAVTCSSLNFLTLVPSAIHPGLADCGGVPSL